MRYSQNKDTFYERNNMRVRGNLNTLINIDLTLPYDPLIIRTLFS